MFYRNIYITSQIRLSIKNKNILLTNKDNQQTVLPIDEINSIIIDTPLVTLTSSFISKCTNEKIAIYVCDEYHYPQSLIIATNLHHRWLEVVQQQLSWGEPYKKRVWREIVKQKIINQNLVLKFNNKNTTYINRLINKVKSGDKDNIEAISASFYFKELFGRYFSRRNEENQINALLNFGYALVRGNISRSLVAHGFITAIGLHHKNIYNNYNLADDIFEPFRPFIDLLVIDLVNNSKGSISLTKDIKIELIKIFEYEVEIEGDSYQIPNAIELVITSLRAGNELILPTFINR